MYAGEYDPTPVREPKTKPPMDVLLDPKLADYHDQLRRRDLRICGWLGLSPDQVFRLDDGDPNEYGEVEVTWEASTPQHPTHGKVIATGARGSWDEPTIHSGRLVLHPVDAGDPAPRLLLGQPCPAHR